VLKILFVDDEPFLLAGIKRILRPYSAEWDVKTAESGEEALKMLETIPIDVVVSDLRMPGMNGIDFFKKLMEKYPSVIRIMLSAESDTKLLLRAVECAHQFLSKPCEAFTIKTTVENACTLKYFMDNPRIRNLISGMKYLPSLPHLYSQIIEKLAMPEPSIEKIARIVSKDPGMTAKLLQLVNSSFFSFYSHVSDSFRAITILGLDKIRSLVLSIHIFQSLTQKDAERFQVQELWEHQLKTATSAKMIAQSLNLEKSHLEEAYMAGLLHDIGKAILLANLPIEFEKIYLNVSPSKQLPNAEDEILGAKHGEIGGYLLGLWALPKSIVQAVAYHHTPSLADDTESHVLAAVHIANTLLGELAPGTYQKKENWDENFLSRLGLEDRIPD
jgi:putative nucleotidyltransferase with HDIG domain